MRYALTIFLSAFLLFQVQPLIGKYILPWFGGTPAVWNACMLFFQVLLLGGYAYAHVVATRVRRVQQPWVHLTFLLVSAALLWFFPPGPDWKPAGGDFPIWRILALLGLTVGMPYFLLATTGPLLQDWFAFREPEKSPYWLYALSNGGSLLALLSYPFLVEPQLSLYWQTRMWAGGHLLFVFLAGWCAFDLRKAAAHKYDEEPSDDPPPTPKKSKPVPEKLNFGVKLPKEKDPNVPPAGIDRLLWCLLAACGSLMLLATTNQMVLDVAAVPFLWVVPLALYLLTFILCFQDDTWYHRGILSLTLMVALAVGSTLLNRGVDVKLWMQIAGYCFVLFTCCMCVHGEMVALKPHPKYLTSFYMLISLGGALGGIFITFAAPVLFPGGFWEFHFGLIATAALACLAISRDPDTLFNRVQPVVMWTFMGGVILLFGGVLGYAAYLDLDLDRTIDFGRNSYGVLFVKEQDDIFNLSSVAINPEGTVVATGNQDPTIKLWSSASGQLTKLIQTPHEIYAVTFSPDGRWVAGGGEDYTVRLYDAETGEAGRMVQTAHVIRSLAFSPDGKQLAVGEKAVQGEGDEQVVTGLVQVFNAETGELLWEKKEGASVTGICYSADSRLLATAGSTVKIRNATSGENVRILDHRSPYGVALSSDAARLISCGGEGIRIWDVESGELLSKVEAESEEHTVRCVAISPDDKFFAAGGSDDVLRIYETATAEVVHDNLLHIGEVNAVAFSRDGEWIVSGAETGSTWDASAGKELATFGYLRYKSLTHGRIMHGQQYQDSAVQQLPTSYYGHTSALGLAIDHHPARWSEQGGLVIGVIGLGTGTTATLARKGDEVRFYEINPLVVKFSREHFTYLKDAERRVKKLDVILGDARISLEQERDRKNRPKFDVLAVDAFSSDAIPVHLLTRECFDLYFDRIKPDGVLAVHISNRYLNLAPVVGGLTDWLSADRRRKFTAVRIFSSDEEEFGTSDASWVLVTRNQELLAHPEIQAADAAVLNAPEQPLWTDDYTNLFEVMRGGWFDE